MQRWRNDPGPCPVDDTPHTACTPGTVAARGAGLVSRTQMDQTVRVPVVRPGWLSPPPTAQTVVTFTTATYKRSEHGPKRKRR